MMTLKECSTSAPAKVILFGEHAAVYRKPALAASIGLRTTCTIRLCDNDGISVRLVNAGCEFQWKASEIDEALMNCRDLEVSPSVHKRVDRLTSSLSSEEHLKSAGKVFAFYLLQLQSLHPTRLAGLEIEVDSNAPLGAGLGSSASFCVAVASAMLGSWGVIPTQSVPSESDRETINRWAYAGEELIHGVCSGIDNTVSCFGGALVYIRGDGGQAAYCKPMKMPRLRMLLVNTKVPRSTQLLVNLVRTRKTDLLMIYDPILEAIGALSSQAVIRLGSNARLLADDEDAQANLHDSLCSLMQTNQGLLDALGVGHPRLTAICQIAREYGMTAKLTGAGGGGCAFVLVPPKCCQETVDSLTVALKEDGFDVFETVLGDEGVRFHE